MADAATPTSTATTIIQLGGVVVQTVAVAVTAYFASKGLASWRRQLIGKRRIQLAEDVLVATYRARRNLSEIRNSGSFGGEGRFRKRGPGEPDEYTDMRDNYFVPLARMRRFTKDAAHFERTMVLAEVYFGPEVGKQMQVLIGAANQVAIAAQMLISIAGQLGVTTERLEKFQDMIWEGHGEDAIRRSTDDAVAAIEKQFAPLLAEAGQERQAWKRAVGWCRAKGNALGKRVRKWWETKGILPPSQG